MLRTALPGIDRNWPRVQVEEAVAELDIAMGRIGPIAEVVGQAGHEKVPPLRVALLELTLARRRAETDLRRFRAHHTIDRLTAAELAEYEGLLSAKGDADSATEAVHRRWRLSVAGDGDPAGA